MKLQTRIGDPSSEEGVRLLTDSYTLMSSLFPPEDNHALSIEDFKNPNIVFLIAEKDGKPCGCGALAIKSTYGELKSIYVEVRTQMKVMRTEMNDDNDGFQTKHCTLEQ